MIGEINIDGVFVPSLLAWALIAFILNVGLRRLLSGIGVYRFVWHRALFDAALYVILLAVVVAVSARILEP